MSGEGAGGGTTADPVIEERIAEAIGRIRMAADRFVVPLRRSEGLVLEALDELCEAIDSCGRDWRQDAAVPKSAALILAELFPAIEACAWLYTDPMRQRILDAAARVADSVRASLDNPEGGLTLRL